MILQTHSQTTYTMFGRLEDDSWFMWKMHQFTLAIHTLAARSLQSPTHVFNSLRPIQTAKRSRIHVLKYNTMTDPL